MALPKIKVDIEVDEDGFVRGMNRAEDKVDRFDKTTTRANRSSERFRKALKLSAAAATAAAAAVTAAATAGFKLVNTFSKQADILVKTSDRLGLNVEKLQELTFAAERSGVSAETLNMAMQRMTRRVAEAAQGTGEAVKAIDELGLSAVALGEMTPDEQLKVFADALEGVENQSDRVRIAMKLFDSEGVALLNMLDGGSESIERYADTLRDLGGVIDEATARQFVQFQDKMTDLRTEFRGLGAEVASGLLPVFEEDLIPVIREDLIPALEALVPFIADVVSGFSSMLNMILSIPEGIRGIRDSLQSLAKNLPTFLSNRYAEGGLFGDGGVFGGTGGDDSSTRLTVTPGSDTLDPRNESGAGGGLPVWGDLAGPVQEQAEKLKEVYGTIESDFSEHTGKMEKIEKDSAKAREATVLGSIGTIADAFASGSDKMVKVAKVAGAAEALINAWRGYSQALADPSLPWFAKFAAAAKVLAAGMGAVNAIKSSSSSGGATSAPAASGGGQVTQPQQQQAQRPTASLTLIGDNFSRRQVVQIAEALNDASGDGQQLVDIRGR